MLTLLGTLLGGLLRFAPEILKFLDKKNERAHELAMLDKQIEADKLKASSAQKLEETRGENAMGLADIQALIEATKAQGQPIAATGNKFMDFWIIAVEVLSKSVRPVLTYWWCIGLYTTALVVEFYTLVYILHDTKADAFMSVFGPEERAICASMFAFWFVDRSLKRIRGSAG